MTDFEGDVAIAESLSLKRSGTYKVCDAVILHRALLPTGTVSDSSMSHMHVSDCNSLMVRSLHLPPYQMLRTRSNKQRCKQVAHGCQSLAQP